MSDQILDKIFGSSNRVKLMKLFLFNPTEFFEKEDIVKRIRVTVSHVRKETNALESIGLIKRTSQFKEFKNKLGIKKKRVQGFVLNKDFVYLNHLKSLLVNTVPLQKNDLVKKISKTCRVKLVVVSGIFLQADESRIDLLIVADNAKEGLLKSTIGKIEAEIGNEIKYSLFSTTDFKYRMSMRDHLIRDIFDYPHQILADRIGL